MFTNVTGYICDRELGKKQAIAHTSISNGCSTKKQVETFIHV